MAEAKPNADAAGDGSSVKKIEPSGQPVDGKRGDDNGHHAKRIQVADPTMPHAAFGSQEYNRANDDRQRSRQRMDQAREVVDHVLSLPNVQDEPRPPGAVGSGAWFGSFFILVFEDRRATN